MTLAVLGAGHLGQQIAHYAITDFHYDKVVFFDDFLTEKEVNGFEILGCSNAVENEFQKNSFDELLIGIGYKHLDVRKKMFERFKPRIPFGKIVHTSTWFDQTSIVGDGCVVFPSCCIDANVNIGQNTILNVSCSISHDTQIGMHCFLSPRVALAGFIKIEEKCIIGINATIIDNIDIVSGTNIGGGTVVIKSIFQSGLYVGNPHKFVR